MSEAALGERFRVLDVDELARWSRQVGHLRVT